MLLCISLVVIRKGPPCSSLAQSCFYLSLYTFLCETSSDEEVAILLSMSSFLCISLIVMRKWPPCPSLAHSIFISLYIYFLFDFSFDEEVATLLLSVTSCVYLTFSLCMYLSLFRSSSDKEVATLLLSSSIYMNFPMHADLFVLV